ncbi:hypothetical protein GF380_01195 [Candidatus Uhrbacteria bacterium]|nr:hypothetical protein [Candidatus Uhrbacteria bacterium]
MKLKGIYINLPKTVIRYYKDKAEKTDTPYQQLIRTALADQMYVEMARTFPDQPETPQQTA